MSEALRLMCIRCGTALPRGSHPAVLRDCAEGDYCRWVPQNPGTAAA